LPVILVGGHNPGEVSKSFGEAEDGVVAIGVVLITDSEVLGDSILSVTTNDLNEGDQMIGIGHNIKAEALKMSVRRQSVPGQPVVVDLNSQLVYAPLSDLVVSAEHIKGVRMTIGRD